MADEKIVIGAETKYPLHGILTLPNENHRLFPAVVLVQGSGPSNMDEKIGNNYPFKDIAEGLSEKGIAVLRYDKRTFVYGKEMKNDTGLTVKEETMEDAILAADFLRKDARIDSSKIFILGHSLGGMLAPRIDAEGGNFAGFIILGGSPRKLEEIIMDQNHLVLNSLNKFLKMIAKKQIAKLSSRFQNIYNLSDEEAKSTVIFGKHSRAYYFKEMGEHPSTDYLKVLNKPILILQGDKDFQVSVEKDFNGYKNLLGDKPNVTFKRYANLNHLFMPAVYGDILKAKKEYNVAQHVDKQVISDISDWIFSI
ncbi:prolyl oligopeptidase family serine peptidase [Paenibacillus sp. VCA1]|uniref:alpha/beta hydrolase family protein n=1 Tax=Paenibacillus sp. VCA1 TaxID=3039148 RepID=UPI0028710C30|nr:prolyl oligopeptidase family serine peptidase [Paenibacillus sp. VCA1]MDR9856071.1 prolyl oligopeptidase family serine peptidase [Paenibacillus sp. VCA1]